LDKKEKERWNSGSIRQWTLRYPKTVFELAAIPPPIRTFLFDMATKEAYLIPKSLGLFEMTLEKVKKAINQIP
jgi:hypothetical protein